MAGVIIATPLRIERAALRGARTPVRRTGMGPRRSQRSVAELRGAAVLVAGIGGGLAPQVRVGDLVVATEVVGGDGHAVACPSAPWLAERLRGLGLAGTVHCGPIISGRRVITGAARMRLAATGALAVDMESAWLAPAGAAAFAVVRSISDTGARPLLHPGTISGVVIAVRGLRRTVPMLDAWADAVRAARLPTEKPEEVS